MASGTCWIVASVLILAAIDQSALIAPGISGAHQDAVEVPVPPVMALVAVAGGVVAAAVVEGVIET
jgi:hypothetical protein